MRPPYSGNWITENPVKDNTVCRCHALRKWRNYTKNHTFSIENLFICISWAAPIFKKMPMKDTGKHENDSRGKTTKGNPESKKTNDYGDSRRMCSNWGKRKYCTPYWNLVLLKDALCSHKALIISSPISWAQLTATKFPFGEILIIYEFPDVQN